MKQAKNRNNMSSSDSTLPMKKTWGLAKWPSFRKWHFQKNFQMIWIFNENSCIFIKISPKFVLKG